MSLAPRSARWFRRVSVVETRSGEVEYPNCPDCPGPTATEGDSDLLQNFDARVVDHRVDDQYAVHLDAPQSVRIFHRRQKEE